MMRLRGKGERGQKKTQEASKSEERKEGGAGITGISKLEMKRLEAGSSCFQPKLTCDV